MTQRSHRIPKAALAAAGALALTLSACGNGDGGGDGPVPAEDGELVPIEVGVLPIVDNAAIYLGQQEGFFEDEGLDLTLTQAQGGAALLPAVVGGDMDFGFSNVTSLVIAESQGLDIEILAGGSGTTGDPDEDFAAVVVPEDSDIQDIADLEGASIAVNTLSNISDSTISEAVEQAGGDPDSIEFVEMPFPDMAGALSNGTVDAAAAVEPFQTLILNDQARAIFSNYAYPVEDLTVAVWFTSGDYLENNPEVVEAFTRAIAESQRYADENPDAVREILPTYTDLDPEVIEQLTLSRYPAAVNRDSLQQINEISEKAGIINEQLDLEELFSDYTVTE
ncbi:ABC transporter substrate-binding protein [Nesterenkonia flava]|uniref:ABC transporter substrate-binding protein n=1 Tax=Nesterenkonia flava TaxID=469799 RepID=A0ABU1FQD2_9MICC|nr:ABC transporter substrate-binding protein [Nesterenkonia flava]MDR5710582.1 ABC transporter substrate-binding protein [Nesterenkonia flava]